MSNKLFDIITVVKSHIKSPIVSSKLLEMIKDYAYEYAKEKFDAFVDEHFPEEKSITSNSPENEKKYFYSKEEVNSNEYMDRLVEELSKYYDRPVMHNFSSPTSPIREYEPLKRHVGCCNTPIYSTSDDTATLGEGTVKYKGKSWKVMKVKFSIVCDEKDSQFESDIKLELVPANRLFSEDESIWVSIKDIDE